MRYILWLSLLFGATGAEAKEFRATTSDDGTIQLSVHIDPEDLRWRSVEGAGRKFTSIQVADGATVAAAGSPAVVVLNRWLAVDPSQTYSIDVVETTPPEILEKFDLAPVQPPSTDAEAALPFRFDTAAYGQVGWGPAPMVAKGALARLSSFTVQTIQISPMQYDAANRQLRLHHDITVTLTPTRPIKARFFESAASITPFALRQARALVDNADDLLASVDAAALRSTGKLLVVTTADMSTAAERLAAMHDMPTKTLVVAAGIAQGDLRAAIKAEYDLGDLTHIVLLGDHVKLPLFLQPAGDSMPSNAAGDLPYTFLVGGDSVADAAISRIPVSMPAEAQLFIDKAAAFVAGRRDEQAREAIMIAHKDEGYSENLDQVIAAPNPQGLLFTKVYGNSGATNASLLATLSSSSYQVVTYRGHGETGRWWTWDFRGHSFGRTELANLAAHNGPMAFFLSIACETADITKAGSLAETLLLGYGRDAPQAGAVAVLGSTKDSFTSINNDFALAVFAALQADPHAGLADLMATGSNQVVRKNAGSREARFNVSQYLALGDPLVSPW